MHDASTIEATIHRLLAERRPGATVCPSEVARALLPDAQDWRSAMEPVRQVAGRMADAGRLVVTRGGIPVEATAPGGPIRLGLPRRNGR